MNESNAENQELIVTFKRGLSEDIARAAVKAAGCAVRRRMRTDFPNEVMLLVKAPAGKQSEAEAKLKGMPSVTATEVNTGGYGVSR